MRHTVVDMTSDLEPASSSSDSALAGPSGVHPRVAILMCTFNGALYLKEQLESFAAQTFLNWTLYVSDDGSTDETLDILALYQAMWGIERLIVFEGPRQGFAANFVSLVRRPEVTGDYFAFSDQDDIWFSEKLARSVSSLAPIGETKPALYCSRTRIVGADKEVIGESPLFAKPPSFQNALVQSIAGANTMLINRAARNLLLQLPVNAPIVAHDWITYLLVTGSGGGVIYDARPSLDYRQHGGNLIGANATLKDRLLRLRGMLSGRFARWNDANLNILFDMVSHLSEKNRAVLENFASMRKGPCIHRISALRSTGVYRQTIHGNLSLVLAVCLGRL